MLSLAENKSVNKYIAGMWLHSFALHLPLYKNHSHHHSHCFEHFPAHLQSSLPLTQGTRSQGNLESQSVQMLIIYPCRALKHLKK